MYGDHREHRMAADKEIIMVLWSGNDCHAAVTLVSSEYLEGQGDFVRMRRTSRITWITIGS